MNVDTDTDVEFVVVIVCVVVCVMVGVIVLYSVLCTQFTAASLLTTNNLSLYITVSKCVSKL